MTNKRADDAERCEYCGALLAQPREGFYFCDERSSHAYREQGPQLERDDRSLADWRDGYERWAAEQERQAYD